MAHTVWQIWEGISLAVAEYVRTFETDLEALEYCERNLDRELHIVPVAKHLNLERVEGKFVGS